ncbi:MAG: DUF2298 domain-containing protein [Dehalococcoidia bacterium]
MTSVVEHAVGRPPATSAIATSRLLTVGLPTAIFAVALALRLLGLNWDSGGMYHPDERFILMTVEGRLGLPWPITPSLLLDPKTSPLNPHFFAYGSFPLYLLKLAAHVASSVQPSFANADLRLVARALSALFDAGSVLMVYFIGLKLGSRAVGLIASALVAFSAIHIQLAHFYAVDSTLVFLLLVAIWLGLSLIDRPSPLKAIALGVIFGLALATKVSVAPLGLAVAGAHLLALGKRDRQSRISPVEQLLGGLALTFVAAGLVFIITQPFTLLDRETFIANVTEQSEMVRRLRDYPYTRQYIDTPEYWYQISQLSLFGLGLPFGVVAWLGLVYALGRAALLRRPGEILLLLWVVPYFLINGGFEVKFLRYMLPLVPFLALFAARGLVDLTAVLGRLGRGGLISGRLVTGFVLASTILWGLAYTQIYSRPHPGAQMSAWIQANVPGGSSIVKEHWEEGIPGLGMYRQGELNLYDPDDATKLRAMANTIAGADYLVFYSNRLYGTIPRLPARYPMTTEYYRRLFSGELGFELVHAEASYPSLLGIAFADNTFVRPGLPKPAGLEPYLPSPRVDLGFADESYSVYDHPLVLLFKRTATLTPAQVEQQLAPFLPPPGSFVPAGVTPRTGSGLMLPSEVAAADRAGGTWREIFPDGSLPNQAPVLFWLLALEVIALAALPLAYLAGSKLPDRGVMLAMPLGLLLVAWLVFLGASVRVVPFERWSIAGAIGLVAVVSAGVFRWKRREIVAELRERQGTILAGKVVFFVAFLAFVWVRTLNPDLWHPARGGEKPMDFAYLNAVVRTTYFPAYDPWFAGGYLNYYYFGQVIVATVIKLTGIVPEVAYNLAVATLFAITAALAFSVVFNLARQNRPGQRAERQAWVAGVVAAVLVCVAGNLDGLAQLLDGLRAAGIPTVQTQIPIVAGAAQAWSGLGRIAAGEATMPAFDFWRSSRMMPPQISITEFPYFTFLFADLHAHLIALPFTLLTIGLGLHFAFGGRGIVPLMLLGLAVGMLRPANTWDFPTYFVLALVAIAIGFIRSSLLGLVWNVLWRAALLYLIGYLAFLPYHQNYELFYSGVDLSKETTPLHQYLAVNGLFLFLGVSWLVYEIARQLQSSGYDRLVRLGVRYWDQLPRVVALASRLGRAPLGAGLIAAVGLFGIALVLAALGLPTPALILLVLVPAGLLALRRYVQRDADSPRDLFVLAMFGLGLGLGAAVDFVTVQGDIARMNTVFKFYLQAWVLLALVAAYAFWRLVLAGPVTEVATTKPAIASRAAWTMALAVLVAGVLIYPLAATPVRVRDRFGPLPATTDGMAYLANAVYQDERGPMELKYDAEAIDWLRANLNGTPTIVEGVTPFYRWGSRMTVYTGLPAVIGWDWHQKQQRWEYQQQVDQRIAEVNAFYGSTDPNAALAFLAKYGVKYVVVGTVERAYYPRNGLAKFDQMNAQLEPVFKNAVTTIYQVRT